MDEAQAYPVCSRGHRDNTVGRPFRRAATAGEKVVVVVGQLVGGREALARGLAHGANPGLVLRLKLGDETLELLLGLRGCSNSACARFHGFVMTTFPLACPSSRYRIASGTPLNG